MEREQGQLLEEPHLTARGRRIRTRRAASLFRHRPAHPARTAALPGTPPEHPELHHDVVGHGAGGRPQCPLGQGVLAAGKPRPFHRDRDDGVAHHCRRRRASRAHAEAHCSAQDVVTRRVLQSQGERAQIRSEPEGPPTLPSLEAVRPKSAQFLS